MVLPSFAVCRCFYCFFLIFFLQSPLDFIPLDFTSEDLQIAAEGLVDGSYQSVTVLLPGGFRWFHAEAGDQLDGRYLVRASRPDPDKLRFFSTRCSHRQAAAFLLEFAQGALRPDKPDWKDYTREVEKV